MESDICFLNQGRAFKVVWDKWERGFIRSAGAQQGELFGGQSLDKNYILLFLARSRDEYLVCNSLHASTAFFSLYMTTSEVASH